MLQGDSSNIRASQFRARHGVAEREIQSGQYRGPLHGIPIGLKDLFYVKGVRNTSGSKIFDHFIPDYDSTLALKLREMGAILLGKLNLHQFAYGPTGENPLWEYAQSLESRTNYGGVERRFCSATASGQCTFAMGTDTGGSIRIPSALCGLVGLKPTYGRLSRYGITALSWSQDHPGPMTRTVEDCALVMNAVAGYDPCDPSSANKPIPDFTQSLRENIKGLRVGLAKEPFEDPVDSEVEHFVRSAIELLGKLGATIHEISWPLYHESKAIASTILMAEATAYHSQLIKRQGCPSRSESEAPVRSGSAYFGR